MALILGLIALSAVDGATESSRIVHAFDVQTQIKAGQPANFDNCTIVGDLDLSTLKIDEVVHFNNTNFKNSVNCESTAFSNAIYFACTRFNGTAEFRNSRFKGYADFWNSKFKGYADFWNSNFNGTAEFGYSNFNGYADFGFSKFNEARFGYSNFNGDADFSNSKYEDAIFGHSSFNGTAEFEVSKFSYADFRFSEFNGYADFSGSNFNGTAEFGVSNFNGYADFSNSKFKGTALFAQSVFNKEANFNNVKFNNIIGFDDSQFVGDALFVKASFNKTLSLTRTRYDKLYIRWYNISGGLSYDDAAYMSILQNFKNLGYFEDYDNCYFQYRVEHRGQPWPGIGSFEVSIRKFGDVFLQYFYGYGKKPLYPLEWSLFFIGFFAVIWKVAGLDASLRFSIRAFLSGTKLFIDPPEIPEPIKSTRPMLEDFLTVERALGALFSILFFLAIGATIVR